jgi:enamine deaminase RidA (YjgF/YER057c/UK114 family)
MPFELVNPKGLQRPIGYAQVAKVSGGKIVYVVGQAPFDELGEVVGKAVLSSSSLK